MKLVSVWWTAAPANWARPPCQILRVAKVLLPIVLISARRVARRAAQRGAGTCSGVAPQAGAQPSLTIGVGDAQAGIAALQELVAGEFEQALGHTQAVDLAEPAAVDFRTSAGKICGETVKPLMTLPGRFRCESLPRPGPAA